jgi:hypothetical protein
MRPCVQQCWPVRNAPLLRVQCAVQALRERSRAHCTSAPIRAEYAALHATLAGAGVCVRLFGHAARHATPDACFPNNWFSLCAGVLTLYPMKCPNRAAERRADIIAQVKAHPGATRLLDLTDAEQRTPRVALEGTGSLVFDHLRRVAYMARSERSDDALAARACDALGFSRLHAFDAADEAGRPVCECPRVRMAWLPCCHVHPCCMLHACHLLSMLSLADTASMLIAALRCARCARADHTNVLLSVGTGFAVVCVEAVPDAAQRTALLASLAAAGREVVTITHAQMGAMCGNVLELRDAHGLPVLAMSTRAHDGFTMEQRTALRRHTAQLLHAGVHTLEEVGGGSVRCCIAELFDA